MHFQYKFYMTSYIRYRGEGKVCFLLSPPSPLLTDQIGKFWNSFVILANFNSFHSEFFSSLCNNSLKISQIYTFHIIWTYELIRVNNLNIKIFVMGGLSPVCNVSKKSPAQAEKFWGPFFQKLAFLNFYGI